ncbi:ribonuclease P protein subunit p25-like protein [Sergentomyia squamirostris]
MGKNKKRKKDKMVEVLQPEGEKIISTAESCPTMTIKSGTKVENVLKFAKKALEQKHRKIIWSGRGGAITRTISCAESLKRNFQLHQVTEIGQESVMNDSGKITHVPTIRIHQSLDKIESSTLGYQDPEGGTAFWLKPSKNNDETSGTASHGRLLKRRKVEISEEKPVE